MHIKKVLPLILIVLTVTGAAGCGRETERTADEISSVAETEDPEKAAQGEDGSSGEESIGGFSVRTSMLPVSAAEDTFIVQDESASSYGLIDKEGNEILSCDYMDMYYIYVNHYDPQVYVAVQEQGAYGVYSLSGEAVIPPSYDGIEGSDYNDSFIVESRDQYGVVDLSGEEILPVAYSCVCCSAQGMYAASNPETSMMEVYDAGGNLTSSWNATIYGDAGFYGYGTEIRNEAAMYTLSGEEIPPVYDLYMLSLNNIDDDSDELVFPYFFYGSDGVFYGVDAQTGETLLTVPLNPGDGTEIMQKYELYQDQGNGALYGIFMFSTWDGQQARNHQYYCLTLGEDGGHVLNLSDINVISAGTLVNNLDFRIGPFCNGTAFAFTQDDQLIVVDADGNIVKELDNNFSDADNCYLLADCAVLNNNGYVYVIDKDGEMICDEEGYVSAGNSKGAMALTRADGSLEIIDCYGNFVVTAEDQLTEFDPKTFTDGDENDAFDCSFYYDSNGACHFINDEYLYEYTVFDDEFSDTIMNGSSGIFTDIDDSCLYVYNMVDGQYEIRIVAEKEN